MIEDTSTRSPLGHFTGIGFPGGSNLSRYIEDQESAGQSQLVNSEMLPRKGSDHYAEAGIAVTDDSTDDDLFVKVTLPSGWARRATDHSMWSEVVDELGRRRVAVFYKASSHDRKASARVVAVEQYIRDCAYYDRDVIVDGQWATPEKVVDAATRLAAEEGEEAAVCDEHFATSRDTYWQGSAVEHRAESAKYAAIAGQHAARRETTTP
jgi:hypothetical protein